MCNMALSMMKEGRDGTGIDDVIALLEEARRLHPTNENVLVNLGQALFEARRYDEVYFSFPRFLLLSAHFS